MSATALAPRDLLVLATLAEGPSHGYGLLTSVEERSDQTLSLDPANLYRLLRRMRRDGWITELAREEDGDARRRTYAITGEGRSVLRAEVRRLETLLRQTRPALRDAEGER